MRAAPPNLKGNCSKFKESEKNRIFFKKVLDGCRVVFAQLNWKECQHE